MEIPNGGNTGKTPGDEERGDEEKRYTQDDQELNEGDSRVSSADEDDEADDQKCPRQGEE